jgi:hypothetical protein
VIGQEIVSSKKNKKIDEKRRRSIEWLFKAS